MMFIFSILWCPGTPANGFATLHGSNYTYGSKVTFQCAEKCALDGASSVTCLADAKWNSSLPTCEYYTTSLYKDLELHGILGSDVECFVLLMAE